MIQIKRLSERSRLPLRATEYAAGFDIFAFLPDEKPLVLFPGDSCSMPLGFATALPNGHAFLLLPRSGLGSKGLSLRNTIGVIDADYRGEWIAKLHHSGDPGVCDPLVIVHGERILQAIPIQTSALALAEVDDLPESDRAGGFGSTGR